MSSCRLTWRCFCLLYHMLFISHSVVRMLQISFGLITQSVAKAFNWDIEVTTTWKYRSRANMVSLMVTSLGLDRAALHVRIQCNVHFARIHSCYTTFVADRRRLLRHSCCWAQRLLHIALTGQNNYWDALHKDVQNCSSGLIYCRNLRKKVGSRPLLEQSSKSVGYATVVTLQQYCL